VNLLLMEISARMKRLLSGLLIAAAITGCVWLVSVTVTLCGMGDLVKHLFVPMTAQTMVAVCPSNLPLKTPSELPPVRASLGMAARIAREKHARTHAMEMVFALMVRALASRDTKERAVKSVYSLLSANAATGVQTIVCHSARALPKSKEKALVENAS